MAASNSLLPPRHPPQLNRPFATRRGLEDEPGEGNARDVDFLYRPTRAMHGRKAFDPGPDARQLAVDQIGTLRPFERHQPQQHNHARNKVQAVAVAMKNPTDYVFAYKAKRNRTGPKVPEALRRIKGQFYPITTSGLKSIWRRARLRKNGPRLPEDLRFHDTRHDFATNLLRTTGNLKLVQKALGHSKIETTTKYAHVLDDEVAAGMEMAAQARAKRRKKALTTKARAQ